jgi:GT2 family glycosyltransferase
MLQIVTLTYKAPELIRELNYSLNKYCSRIDYEWIIRDNAADEVIDDPKVKVIPCENTGNFGTMHNDIMETITQKKYTLLLNNDTIALNDFISPMIRIMEKDESVGVVGANLIYPDGAQQHAGVIFWDDKTPLNVNSPVITKLGLNERLADNSRHYQAVTGACLMIRSDLFRTLKFDPVYEWCFDDVDLCLRARIEYKKNVVYCAQAKMIHIENYSVSKNPTNLKPSYSPSFNHLKNKFKHLLQADSDLYKMNYGLYL